MPQYALARHVFVCMQGEHVVFLDVRKDRYFALESAPTAGLGDCVPGWPVTEPPDREAPSAVIALLLEKGILTSDAAGGKQASPVKNEPIVGDLAADGLDEPPTVTLGAVVRFVSAAIRAALMLKYRPLEAVVDRVGSRITRAQVVKLDIARLHELVSVFATLRPFFFTAKDACLFDALALSEYLAGYRVYPRWVFAVQARPFAAHCWLQRDGLVLNDTVDHVTRYTPIMVV